MNLKKVALLALGIIGFTGAGAQTEVRYYTNKGNFDIRLTDALTPRTVDSFIARVSEKFYDGLIFHRVIAGFMIQGGDPLGTGAGGPGYTIPDELVPSLKNIPGALAMANAGPNTNGCQFYVNVATNAWLDNHYTVFGMVYNNYSVVQTISLVATDVNNRPLTPVVIDSIRITKLHTAYTGNLASSIAVPVYPNPARGIFNIDLPSICTKVELLNMAGQVVYKKEASGLLQIDMSHEPTGLYLVRITNANGTYEHKIVLQ